MRLVLRLSLIFVAVSALLLGRGGEARAARLNRLARPRRLLARGRR